MKKITKRKTLSFMLALTMTLTIPAELSKTQPVKAFEKDAVEELQRQLIPLPLKYEVKEGKYTLKEDTIIYVRGRNDDETAELHQMAENVAIRFRASTGFALPVVDGESIDKGHLYFSTLDSAEGLGNEGYTITSNASGVVAKAYDPAGIFNATQTLRQLLPASIEKSSVVEGVAWDMPSVDIEDKPEYKFRSTMLDVSRHFFTVDQVKRHIDNVSQYKINKLHMHLSDDQGWRLEIKGEMEGENLSDLTTIGGSSSGDGWGGIRAGYYTQDDFKELVAYAAERNMEIIPEFDMPSHVNAAQASLAFLNKNGKKTELYHGIDVGWNSFDCNDERVYAFVDEVIKQVAAISPSKYIHIGGDEAHSTSKADYAKFMNRATEIAKKYNKIPIGWQAYDDAIENGSDGISQYWATNGSKLKAGMKHVVAPANIAYIDMKYPAGDMEYDIGLQWAAKISVKTAYSWDPTDYGTKDQIEGIEAPMWSETLTSDTSLDYMAFPRIIGHAEVGWTPKDMRSWDEYKLRLKTYDERLKNQGIAYYKDQEVWEIPYEPVNAYWDLDEGEGTTIQDDTGTYQGTLQEGVSWLEGIKGNALHFDGTGYVDLGIQDLKGNWTMGMWINRKDNSSTNTVLLSGTQGEIKLEQWKNTKKVGITEFGVEDYTFDYIAPVDAWVHLTFVCDDSGTSLYANGELQDRLPVVIKGPAARIGANNKTGLADTGFMNGILDELKIYNHALTEEEVKQLYTQDTINYSIEDLKQRMQDVESYHKDDYTASSWAVLETALVMARTAIVTENVTQEMINTAYDMLDAAIKNLKEAVQEDNIRIASYNIAAGRKPDITKMNALLVENSVDVAGVQEVDHFNNRNNFDMLKKFADLGGLPYYSFQKAISYGGGEYGIGTLSKLEIKDKRGGALNSVGISEARAWQRIMVEKDGKEIAVYNTHLTHESREARERQLREVLTIMDEDPTVYKALTGDFNTDQSLKEVYPMLENYNIANGYHDVWYDTYNQIDEDMNVRCIDNIITTRNLQVNKVEMIENKLSDHNALIADFEFLDEVQPERQLLDYLLADASAYVEEEYTPETFAALQYAIDTAIQLTESATQEQIDVVIAQLRNAMSALQHRYVIINDATVGSGLNQFNYVGEWQTSVNYPELFYQGDEHWFNFGRYVEGDTIPYFTITFEGTGIELYGNLDKMMGIYEATIDDGEAIDVDAYRSEKRTQALVYSIRDLPYGEHTIKVQSTQRKNTASSSTDIEIDFAKIFNEKAPEDTMLVKTMLESAIIKAKSFIETETFKVLAPSVQAMLQLRLQEAKTVYANGTASSQQILDAWLQLSNALHYADFKADKEALRTLVDICKAIDTSMYEEASVEKLQLAILEAERVLDDDGVLQATIDVTYGKLLKAKEDLVIKPSEEADKTVLSYFIKKIDEVILNQHKYNLEDDSWTVLEEALTEAKRVFEDISASQEMVNDAIRKLSNAYENIRLLPDEALLAQLEEFIQVVNNINRRLYSDKNLLLIDQIIVEVSTMLETKDFTDYENLTKKIDEVLLIITNNKIKADSNQIMKGTTDKLETNTNRPINHNSIAKTGDASSVVQSTLLILLSGGALIAMKRRRLK